MEAQKKLIGQWLRMDGSYVIAINKIGEDGKLEAAYYNPSPIHVEQATVSWHENMWKVFI